MRQLIWSVFIAVVTQACATSFHGSVPLSNGRELVVGGRAGQPAVWTCATNNASQECQLVEVVE
jgi:hypothetical protein